MNHPGYTMESPRRILVKASQCVGISVRFGHTGGSSLIARRDAGRCLSPDRAQTIKFARPDQPASVQTTWDLRMNGLRCFVLFWMAICLLAGLPVVAGEPLASDASDVQPQTRLTARAVAQRDAREASPPAKSDVQPTGDALASEGLPDLCGLPSDRVVATFHEGLPAHDRWPTEEESWPVETMRWKGDAFLLPRLPLRYDGWGIRESWKAPVLVRLAADVSLPAGKQTLLMRARGLGRLWVDGRVVAETGPLTSSPNGEEPITPVADPPLPGLRRASHRLQERIVEVEIPERDAGPVRVVLETVAGGKGFRPEPGELCVAVRMPDGQSFSILRPVSLTAKTLALTDTAVDAALARIETSLSDYDDQARRTAAASREAFWKRRHETAREWVRQNPPPAVPEVSGSKAVAEADHPIDAFVVARIERAQAASAQTPEVEARQFHAQVLPILRSECFRCHGEKDQGGLQLNSRQKALAGGDSGLPAVSPGDSGDSEMIARLRSDDPDVRMPPTGKPLPEEQIKILEAWIDAGAHWPAVPLTAEQTELAPLVDDTRFVRRAYLDTVGVVPEEDQVRAFLSDQSPGKRARLIDRLLDDPRWADHWMGYWQDLLAENPTLINATLNSTGPFRWFLYEALRDDKPLDRMITELLLMRGSPHDGGSAGFALAAQNDSPFAAKGHVAASAFLGIELQCARCHDSPYHSTTQRDLYSLAAMLARKPLVVPASSSVPAAFFASKGRESLIEVTLRPGEDVAPTWPFAEITGAADDDAMTALMENPEDSRERLATLITAPQNVRFAQVTANRIWRRLIGAGLVEPPHDWEGSAPSDPALLDWLARELVANDYSFKHLTRTIMTSRLYQREAVGENRAADPELRFFNAPDRRRMSAEQIVDSFYVAAGQAMDIEPMTLDPDGRRASSSRNSYGKPHRSWMLVSTSNERDRPSLTFPRAAVVVDVLEAFGWSADRQAPLTDREADPNVRQPAVIANSTLTVWLTRASDGSPLADLAVEAESVDELVDSVFLRFLSRLPTQEEKAMFAVPLIEQFSERLIPADQVRPPKLWEPLPRVTWSNHLRSEANTIQQEHERRARIGPPADPRLRADWREVYEDFVWSVVNLREFVWMP
jgi:hypothetical protein